MRFFAMALVALVCLQAPSLAETIQLKNGETLKGTILMMDQSKVQLKTDDEDGGTKTLKRDTIAQITFGEQAEMTRRSFSVAKMLREIRDSGLDDATWKDLEERINVIDTPEVKRYLDDTIAGLRQDMEQVRRDAREAQREIKQLSEEYAPQADTLNDYVIAIRQILGAGAELEEAEVEVAVDVEEADSTKTPQRTARSTNTLGNSGKDRSDK